MQKNLEFTLVWLSQSVWYLPYLNSEFFFLYFLKLTEHVLSFVGLRILGILIESWFGCKN